MNQKSSKGKSKLNNTKKEQKIDSEADNEKKDIDNKQELKTEPVHIAQIMGKWIGGGVESVIMNYYENIDRTKFQFDFICDDDSTNIPYEKIEKLGGKVILVPPYQKVFKYIKTLKKIFKENNYKIVHSNINTLSVFPLYAAKKAGVPVRIAHSHSTSNKKEWKKNAVKNVLRPFSKKNANVYFACSELAARYLFGNKTFEEGKVTIINNAINLEKFKFNQGKREKLRKELKIKDDEFVVGHIGRFVSQKNHTFLIDIFNELRKENNKAVLLLIGQGPLQDQIKEKVRELGIEDSVRFAGQVDNASDYYNAMDVFVLPSLYEGLGMVLIEAQVNELPCIASTEVPKEASVSNQVEFISLKEVVKKWVDDILEKNRKDCKFAYKEAYEKYDIRKECQKLQDEYKRKIKEHAIE